MKKILTLLLTIIYVFEINAANALENSYLFWLRLQDNDYDIIPKIEERFDTFVPIVSVIYDDFSTWEIKKLAKTFEKLWKNRVYHVDINPFWYTLKELIDSKDHKWWEKKYKTLFKLIKKYEVKVIFRFLHEMNGWWYSWASKPNEFKIFWKMVWNWSREEWLDKSDILFDFSVNSQDLPAIPGALINQWTPVITCNQEIKKKTWCLTFEDYYPGDEYIDTVGVTIYNWWKWARSETWANWRTPMEVINEPWYHALDRLKKLWKPIFIDEAWTTSIYHNWKYDIYKLMDIYDKYHSWTIDKLAFWTEIKNNWIKQYHNLLLSPQIIWWIYFNADVTYWLRDRSKIWELDWTAIDTDKNFVYPAILEILFDPKNIKNPAIYFDIPKKIILEKEWITEFQMYKIEKIISPIINFTEWKIIASDDFPWSKKNIKYQYHLEKKLENDPVLCNQLKLNFKALDCKESPAENMQHKKEALKYIVSISKNKQFNKYELKKNIENLRLKLNYKSKFLINQNSIEWKKIASMIEYLNFYEINYLN